MQLFTHMLQRALALDLLQVAPIRHQNQVKGLKISTPDLSAAQI